MKKKQCSLSEIHDIELEILNFLRYICEKNKITYCLTYGSLLGAVRHKGFIPWDDDIDVAIPAEEIAKFCECFEKEKNTFFALVSPKNEKFSIEPWYKIRRNNTTSMPKKLEKIQKHWGICIDIFPMFPVGNSKLAQLTKLKLFSMADTLLRANTAKYIDDSSTALKILGFFPTSFRRFAANCIMKGLYSGNKSSEFISDGFAIFKRQDFFGNTAALPFEDEYFSAPTEYDKILTEMYGDYMTLPPEEDRIDHSAEAGLIIWEINDDPA